MKVKDLLKPIYDKDEFAKLKNKIESMIKSIDEDVELLNLEKIEKLVKTWEDFDKKFDVTKNRLSEIETIGNQLLKIIEKKLTKLKEVKVLNKRLVKELEKELTVFRDKIKKHLEEQKQKYKDNVSKKR